ncbi:MAG TPA: diguanylate cyclase [Desulfobulbaceae bacterium]|nr:diguanylate cyclase [Desulfobulbaceae bacterium]
MMKNQEDTPRKPIILIADDNQVIIKLLGELFTREGYQVAEVHDGESVLKLLPSIHPDLVLLDVDLPEMSGFDVCRKLKHDPASADIPVLFVTSRNDKKDILAGFAAGGQDYVVKPSTRAELLARVRTHLALRQAQQRLKASEARYRELSLRDDLTGFYNTRYLYQTLQGQLDMHRTRPLSVIFMDIDEFKYVVDTYGHLNGSRTLAELADVVRSVLPEGCYGVSYGGDEFVIVLAGYDHNQGMQVAERIRRAVEKSSFLSTMDLSIHITVSCGVATFPEDAQTLTDLLAAADHALFEVKKHGKNAVGSFH